MEEQSPSDADWLAAVRSEFAANETIRRDFRAGVESGDLASLRTEDWPFSLVPKPLPKRIWMYWAQGWHTAPDIVKRCRDSWARCNPGWDLIALDDENVQGFSDVREVTAGKTIGVAASSDILRLHLLDRHGGAWADATTVCTRPLDDWLPLLMQSGFFAFARPRPDRLLASWFLAAEPGNLIVGHWLALTRRYWSLVREADHYFWCHYLFAHGCRTNRTMAAGWAVTPQLSAYGSLQPQLLTFPTAVRDEALASVTARSVPIFKLSHKYKVPLDDDGPLSLLVKALLASP